MPKLCEFLGRESGDSPLEGFEFPHTANDITISFREYVLYGIGVGFLLVWLMGRKRTGSGKM
jgi:hypothetical protein